MKKSIVAIAALLSALMLSTSMKAQSSADFWNRFFVEGTAGVNAAITVHPVGINPSVGMNLEYAAGKWFNDLLGIELGWKGINVDGKSRHCVAASLLLSPFRFGFGGDPEDKPASVEIDLSTGWEYLNGKPSFLLGGAIRPVYRISPEISVFASFEAFTTLDSKNEGAIRFVSVPVLTAAIGVRYEIRLS